MSDSGAPRAIACEHADRCGGCPAIELPYVDQLSLKRGRVVTALARYGSLELVYADPVLGAEPIVAYRTRAKLMIGPRGAVGLFAKGGGHDVVDVPQCRVLSPVVARVVAAVRLRVQHDATAGGPLAPGPLRAIDVRELETGREARALLTLVVGRGYDLNALRAVGASLLAEIPEVIGVAASLHDGETPQVLGSETHVLAGAAEAEDRVGECVHLATFGSFVQAHRVQAARIHDLLATHLGLAREPGAEPPRVLDLYAGSGAIALALASRGAEVTCVEAFGPAAARIEKAAHASSLAVRSIHSDVASALRGLQEKGARFDAVIANPPRRGIGPAAREWLARLGAPAVAYVSCDPDTLARDLDHLARLGYRCASAQPLDMIPLSDEVETVAILRRAPAPGPRVLFEDDTALFVEKAAHEPIAPHATRNDYADSLLSRVRRLPGAEDATQVHAMGVGTSGVALFARTAAHAEGWRRALEGSRKVYLAGTRGVLPTKGSITRDFARGEAPDSSPSRTKYRRLAVFAGHCVARVMPESSARASRDDRTRQIRRHLASVGHPVLGDERFGHAATNRHFEEKYGLDRTFLHCVRFEIDHPVSAAHLVVDSPLSGDLQTVLERAGGPGTLQLLEQKNALGRNNSSIPPPPSVRTSGVVSLHDSSPMSASEGRILRADIVGDEDDPRD
ncbi:MAG TPA: RsmD family RNA methyltransferase [Polyangiaceae bacterium]|jgi:23S rRNA (uracil1939-C5)-methyltransferase